MKPQELSNEELIEACKHIPLTTELDLKHIEELITRFERLSLGQQADEACKKAEELQQPTLQVGWEYLRNDGVWMEIVKKTNSGIYPYVSKSGFTYSSYGSNYIPKGSEYDLDLSTVRPVKKQQQDDEVEALAREIYSTHCQSMSPKQSFELAEGFIQTRNERRGKNGN